jgi:hypothetical protein
VPVIVAPQAGIELTTTITAAREVLHVVALVVEHHLKPNQGEGAMLGDNRARADGGRAQAGGRAWTGGGGVRCVCGGGRWERKKKNEPVTT